MVAQFRRNLLLLFVPIPINFLSQNLIPRQIQLKFLCFLDESQNTFRTRKIESNISLQTLSLSVPTASRAAWTPLSRNNQLGTHRIEAVGRQLWPRAVNRDPRWPVSVACRWRKDADRYSPREEEEEEEGREPSKCGAARLRALYRGYEARNARYPRPHPASLPFHRRGDRQRERRNVLRYRGFASTVAPLASRLEKMTSNSRPRLNDQDDNDEDHDCSKLGWIRSLSGARLKQGGVGVAELEDGARLATTGSCCVKVKRALLRGVGRRIMVLYIDATGSHFPSILLLQ